MSSAAISQEAIVNIDEAAKTVQDIKSNINEDTVYTLPLGGLKALEMDGQMHFISDTGRFVIKGQIYDLLSQKYLDRFSEVKEVSQRINFAKLPGANLNLMTTISQFNKEQDQGKKEVFVFVDPECQSCQTFINQTEKINDHYRFTFIPIPALGDRSNILTKRLACAADPKEAYESLKKGTVANLKITEPCSTAKNDTTLLVAHMLRIDGVPFVIAPNGEIARGAVQNLKQWLEWNNN